MFDQSADKLIEQNADRFLSSYSNQKFPDYPAYPDYFIDCYERYCPEGCDVGCPGSKDGYLPVVQPKGKNLKPILPNLGNCPKKEKRVYMRAHIGELTEDEVKYIGDTDALIVFRPVEDIPRNTPEEENEHSRLLASFEAFKIADRKTLPRQKRLQIATAMAMMKKASDFRKVRKRALCYASIIGNVPGIPAEQSVPATILASPDNVPGAVSKSAVLPSSAPPPKTKKKRVKSANPKPQVPTKGVIHDALVALFHKNPKAAREYSAERLADILKSRKKNPIKRCTASGVKATLAWQDYCKPFRRREKTTSLDARGNTRDRRVQTPSEILDEQSADAQDEPSETDQD